MNLISVLLRSVLGVTLIAGATLVGVGAGCGGVVTADPRDEEGSQVASAYEPPTTYMCQQHIPEGACASCLKDAASGECGALRDECDESTECVSFGECQFECAQNVGCCEGCSAENPSGFARYAEYIECAVCDECASACQGLFPDLCGA